MATWTNPGTKTDGPLTSAWLNDNYRAQLLWLKQLLTDGTSDTNSDLRILRANASDTAFSTRRSADAFSTLALTAGGQIQFGDGTAAPSASLDYFALGDLERGVILERAGEAVFRIKGTNSGDGALLSMYSGALNITELGRGVAGSPAQLMMLGVDGVASYLQAEGAGRLSAVGGLTSEGALQVGYAPGGANQRIMMYTTTTPNTPGSGSAYLYFTESAGKLSLQVRWPGGSVTTIATEP